jgi:CubicO group peptidase (beta-lactamase class C family)
MRFAFVPALLLVAIALPPPAASAAPSAAGCAEASQEKYSAFFDDALGDRLERDGVPGAVVSVVSGGRTVFTRGYGQADVERGVAFDPSRSLVRVASITKLFTWTTVMQQVEAGRLDLDTDVNGYLDFRLPDTYPQPITLRHLMNHTAGFEDRIVGTGARTAGDVPPLGRYLADAMPHRIRPPGVVSAYSNYGAALAGYVVSRVSGQPYDAYVRDRILVPLGMTRSTASEPVPAALAGDLARSYSDGEPVPFTFDRLGPDGSISATADDMARFMTAHLTGGGQILTPATTATMHKRSFAADPRLGGYAHGFMDRPVDGRPVLMHDGGWEGFLSGLVLVPTCGLGLFISTNATEGGDALAATVSAFLHRFASPPTTAARVDVPSPPTAPRTGFYKPTRRTESTLEKVLTLLGPARLRVDRDGTVQFKGGEWTDDGAGLYRRDDGRDHLVFRAGPDGRFYAATDGPTYELMPWVETLPVNLGVLAVFAVAALSALAVPVAAVWRRLRRRPSGTIDAWRAARGVTAGAALAGLAGLVAIAVTLAGDTSEFIYGVPPAFRLVLAVPVGALLAAAAGLFLTARGWRRAGVLARTHQVLLFAGIGALTWFLAQWNLLGWQFHP